MPYVPDLVFQVYENVGTGLPPQERRVCSCEFEYPTRWPQFYKALLSTDDDRVRSAIEVLEERDRVLEHHFQERCDGGVFEYPTRWQEFYEPLLFGTGADFTTAANVLEERDRALESHIDTMTCFGVDYAHGVTCEFEYPTRWRDIAPLLLANDDAQVQIAVAQLQQRDIDLETHLSTRACGEVVVPPIYPNLVMQVYENVGIAYAFTVDATWNDLAYASGDAIEYLTDSTLTYWSGPGVSGGSLGDGGYVNFRLPAGTYDRIDCTFSFLNPNPPTSSTGTHQIMIRARNLSNTVTLNQYTQSFTGGMAGPTYTASIPSPWTISEDFFLYTYILLDPSVSGLGPQSHPSAPTLIVRGNA